MTRLEARLLVALIVAAAAAVYALAGGWMLARRLCVRLFSFSHGRQPWQPPECERVRDDVLLRWKRREFALWASHMHGGYVLVGHAIYLPALRLQWARTDRKDTKEQ